MYWISFITQALAAAPPNSIRTYDFLSFPALHRHNRDWISFQFESYNRTFQLELVPNESFQMAGSVIEVFSEKGSYQLPLTTRHVYDGTVLGEENSWVRVVIHDEKKMDIEGAVSIDSQLYHIQSIRNYLRAKRITDVEIATANTRKLSQLISPLIIIKEEDPDRPIGKYDEKIFKRADEISSCGTDTTNGFNAVKQLHLNSKYALTSKASSECPASKKLLLMGVAADCSYVAEKGSRGEALNSILSIWNLVSKVYEDQFNVQLGVGKVLIQESCSQNDENLKWNRDCSVPSYTISNRLSDFSKWRGTQTDNLGLWHLMTKCSTIPAVGIAWLSTVCTSNVITQGDQFVSGTGVSSIVPVEWKVVAHEIGHNFGAIHDCTSQGCSQCSACSSECDCKSQFLMNPLDTSVTDSFSPGSVTLICAGVNDAKCLIEPGSARLIESGICGNGVKEANEQCDCGLPADCTNDPCCDAATCQLKAGAVCSNKNDNCCSDTCQFLPASTVCHVSGGVCDNSANCPGNSGSCPLDTFVQDGTKCNTTNVNFINKGVEAQCASGQCTSRDLQCVGSGVVTTTKACLGFGNSCQMNCQDSNGVCYLLTGNFLDGTSCGGIGRCKNGSCDGSNIFAMAMLWITTYPQFGWPIVAIIGLIILSSIYGCLKTCFCRKTVVQNPRIFDAIAAQRAFDNRPLQNRSLQQDNIVQGGPLRMRQSGEQLNFQRGDIVVQSVDERSPERTNNRKGRVVISY